MVIRIGKGFVRLMIFLLILVGLYRGGEWLLNIAYPFHYRELIMEYSEIYGVDPYLVVSIIRNESKFNPNAVSRKEARGLMQIAPITGEWASEKLQIENYTHERLYEPQLNIQIGCWYLSILKEQFHNNINLMVAAYNAGNGNVSKWLDNPEYSADGKALTHIPFKETRTYQERVLRDYEYYRVIDESGLFGLIKLLIRGTLG